MASIHGVVAAPFSGAYTAAKHGVVGLTKNAAAEYGAQGLHINCGLLSDEASFSTGGYYLVDGGYTSL